MILGKRFILTNQIFRCFKVFFMTSLSLITDGVHGFRGDDINLYPSHACIQAPIQKKFKSQTDIR